MGNYKNRIEINPKILLGKPVFKGTRIPLYVVLDIQISFFPYLQNNSLSRVSQMNLSQ